MSTTYTTQQLLGAVAELRNHVPNWMLSTFFPNVIQSDVEEIKFDVEGRDGRLAPFVSPLVAGQVVDGRGYTTNTFKPAYLKPKHIIDPRAPLRRMMGEPLTGTMTVGERQARIVNERLMDQMEMIHRRLEWMACQVLMKGAITVEGDGHPMAEVNFQRDPSLTVTLAGGNRWGQADISPIDSLESLADTMSELCGAGATDAIMDKAAWALFKADAKLDRLLDRTLGQRTSVELGYTVGDANTPTFKGALSGINLWVYNPVIENADGSFGPIFSAKSLTIIARNALGGMQHYGAILDPAAGMVPQQMFPKTWMEQDPPVVYLMTQSAPLVVPLRPNASMHIRVA